MDAVRRDRIAGYSALRAKAPTAGPRRRRPLQPRRRAAVPLAVFALALAIFVVDTVTPYQIAAATFYVVVVLLAARLWRRREVVGVSLACVVLTVVSYLFTRHGDFEVGLANTSISLLAIAATTYLAIRMQEAHDQAARARADLERVGRIVTMGEIAASIAHEVNQPLAAISANAGACVRWLGADPPNLARVDASVASIVQDARRASEILSRVRAHTRGGEPRKAWIDPNALIRETMALLQAPLRESQIELHTDLAADVATIHADPVQVQQVLTNLLVNAMEAIDERGAAREVRVSSRRTGARDIRIAVEDTGVGLRTERIDRLFDAFHSTKAEGMGIGLAICRSIVEAHGGRLSAGPATRGGGAVFSFTLSGAREPST